MIIRMILINSKKKGYRQLKKYSKLPGEDISDSD